MNKIYLFPILAAVSMPVWSFDYDFTLETRADFKHSKTKKETNTNTTSKDSFNGFESGLIRLNMQGKVNETLSYRFRYRFNKQYVNTTRDNSSTDLDLAYIDHKNSLFTLRAGKMNWGEAYGRESMMSSTDLFLQTEAFKAYNTKLGTYRFGATAMFKIADAHNLSVAVSNPNPVQSDATGEKKNNSLGYGVHYNSSMFGKKFQPVLSYQLAKQDADKDGALNKNADYTMMAAGFKSQITDVFFIEADWKQFEAEKRSTTALAADGKTTSIYANLNYKINEFTPFLSYVNDKFKNEDAGSTADYKMNTFAAGTMWAPFEATNFRYHLSYSRSVKKFDSSAATNKKETNDSIIAGFKINI